VGEMNSRLSTNLNLKNKKEPKKEDLAGLGLKRIFSDNKNQLLVYGNSLEISPRFFKINKLQKRLEIKDGEKNFILSHTPNEVSAAIILELFVELKNEKKYFSEGITNNFISPLGILKIEQNSFKIPKKKIYLIGLKPKDMDKFIDLKEKKQKRIRVIGSVLFALAQMHKNNIALGDSSLENIFVKKSTNLAMFGPPAQLRVISNKKEGETESLIFICNLLANNLISKKEIDIFIEHYLQSFETEDKKINNEYKQKLKKQLEYLFEKYYKN
jgi:tRNA A-37 threonylcarbamoyl transferase component Bud32